ncbi:MAG: ATP-binding cassette domain-containing protein [Bacteroidota bacterium]|nr:ATP-binding cassette domain-containing protein [Bacteroidota bacterium]
MLSLNHITKVFNPGKSNEIVALNDLSLEINKGSFTVIIGVNGSGKSTLLNLIGGAEKPTRGKIFINGTEVTSLPEYKRSRWVGRVFQNPNNGTAPDLSILDNFRLAALRTVPKRIKIGNNADFKKRVQERIALLGMGLENKVLQQMGNLSGGQRQALTLLMSSMDATQLLLLDEPTAALDPKSSQVVLNLASTLHKEYGITLILITHNLKDAWQFGDRLIQIDQGKNIRDLNSDEKKTLQLQEVFNWFG